MKIEVENYKGIEFVRISSLPGDQRDSFLKTAGPQKIIKILRDKELLNDCIQYSDYSDWYSKNYSTETTKSIQPAKRGLPIPHIKLKKVYG
jgi:hypothetical protein